MRRRLFSDMVSLVSVSLFLAVVVVMAYKSTLYLGVCVWREMKSGQCHVQISNYGPDWAGGRQTLACHEQGAM